MKYGVIALPLIMLFAAGTATAAEPIDKQVRLFGTIPSEVFMVMDPGQWWNKVHPLEWRDGQGFEPFQKKLLMKSSIGAITAHLTQPAQMTSGDKVINMTLSIDKKELSTVPREIVSLDDVGKNMHLDFVLAAEGLSIPAAGEYTGTFGMMFETAPPL